MMPANLLLGAPGVYRVPTEPLRALTGVRMDVCAFLGVAPRGPAQVPMAVESWDAYLRLFGGFEGPGLLPYAVASFFEQGGRRAYVVRVVHHYGSEWDDMGVAEGEVPGATPRGGGVLVLRACDEGIWGNRLRATLGFRTRPFAFGAAATDRLTLMDDAAVLPGALLRLTLPGGVPVLRFVADVQEEWRPDLRETLRDAVLEFPMPTEPERAEIVEADLMVDDGDGRTELHERLGLSPLHPRWMAATLHRDSILVRAHPAWIAGDLLPDDPYLRPPAPPRAPQFTCGRDRYPDIAPSDFFDAGWVPGDERPGSGIHALAELSDLSLVVAPDLYSPAPLVPIESVADPVSLAGPVFQRCVEPNPPPPAAVPDLICPDGRPPDPEGMQLQLDGLRLDPTLPAEREQIVLLQQRLVEFAGQLGTLAALLDVPPGLNQRQVLAWRARFGSACAAAYHPWLDVVRRDDRRGVAIRINPSAVAAGIIARQEVAFGVPHGPANVLAAGVVKVADQLSSARHDELHPVGINVFLRERDGMRLTAARTLSRDPAYRQLSVRRLVTLLARTLDQQMQWTVFEPNNHELRDDVSRMLNAYLRQLFLANAFQGASEREAFFVRCDEALNPQRVIDAGQLVVEVGVAPAEPLEFVVLRIARDGDGTLRIGG